MRQRKAKIGKKPEQVTMQGKLITIVSRYCKSPPATAAQEASHLVVFILIPNIYLLGHLYHQLTQDKDARTPGNCSVETTLGRETSASGAISLKKNTELPGWPGG